jgi:uncharacterized repeat protein (TIGR01451 family)
MFPIVGLSLETRSNSARRYSYALLLLLLLAKIASASCPNFGSASNVGTGAGPNGVAIGDFNRDGRPDLAIVNATDSTVTVLLQNANGTYASATYASGASGQPDAVVASDLNGDGVLDLVVANPGSSSIAVFLGNANGTFNSANPYSAGGTPQAIVVGDFNLDGKPDVAVANSGTNQIALLAGNGNGTFQTPASTSSGGSTIRGLAAGDFNDDGKLDLAVTASTTVNVLLGNGDETFQGAATYATSNAPLDVAVADFNRDGISDLAIATSSHVEILLGNANGTFQSAVAYSAGSTGTADYALRTGDFNGDGKVDVIITNVASGNIALLLGNGTGGLGAVTTFAVVTQSGPTQVQRLAVADINGDGKPDVAVTNYSTSNVSVVLNNDTCFTNCGTLSSAGTFTAQSVPLSVAMGDFNRDGRMDIAVANFGSGNVSVLLGNAAGTFDPQTTFTAGSGPSAVVAGDFDRDGKLDLAVANANSNNISVLFGNGSGGFSAATNVTAGLGPNAIATGDFNGDGILDLAVANASSNNVSILLGNGSSFESATNFSVGSAPLAIFAGDFNRDGKLDLAVANANSNNVSLLFGVGDGTFGTATNLFAPSTPWAITGGDFDANGTIDLAVADNGSHNVSVFLGAGDGSFGSATTFSVGTAPYAVMTADFNRDGKLDLLVGNGNSNTVSFLAGAGNGSFSAPANTIVGSNPVALAAGDINRDGNVDAVVIMNNGTNDDVALLLGACPVSDLTITKSHTGNFTQGQSGVTYSITVSNAGTAATSGTVTVVDTLPTGLSATAISGTNWNCVLATLTCMRTDALAASSSYPEAITLTANVASNAASTLTNTATVSGGGEINTANDTSSDLTTIQPPADLTVSKSHSVTFFQGSTGVYLLTVNNVGTGPTSGTVSVTDNPPTGLTITSMDGGGSWSCNTPTRTCTRSDVLAAASSYGPITVSVSIAGNAASSVTNSATVSGGGQLNTSNDSVSDPTTIVPPPDLTITKSHVGNFVQGEIGATYTITVSNAGTGPTLSAVSVTDTFTNTIPASMTATGLSGTGWSCNLGTRTCTRSDALAPGASYPNITLTVNVSAPAAQFLINTATVSGGGELNSANDSANDVTDIDPTNCVAFRSATYPVTAGGTAIAVGDFNNDLSADLALLSQTGSVVSVLLNAGNGTFGTATTYAAGSSPVAIATADFNHDFNPDLVVAESTGGISMLLGNGDGTFRSPQHFSAGAQSVAIATADFNGDGNLDVAVANSTDKTVSILLGSGTGTFGAPTNLSLGSGGPVSILAGDFDSDGKADLVVATSGDKTLWTFRGKGDGTFFSPVTLSLGFTPRAIAAGDLNHDFNLDLVITNGDASQPNQVYVYLNNVVSSGFHFAAAYRIPGQPILSSVAITDVDADGNFDVVCGSGSSLWVFNGLGTGFLGNLTEISTASSAIAAVATGDFNSDQKGDAIAVDSSKALVFLESCPDLAITKSHTGNFYEGQTGATYSIIVSNLAGKATTNGNVDVKDVLPNGLTATAISGTNWFCTLASLTCDRSDALAPGSSYEPITVTVSVAGNAPSSLTNSATVAGLESNIANETANDTTTITPLVITKSHSGNFTQGETGKTYTLRVTNFGTNPTSGTVTTTDTLPAGLTATAISGTGWTCTLATLTCTRSDSLAAGASYPDVTVTVTVASNAPASVTNTVTVSGSGNGNLTNSASDPTTIIQLPDLTITKSHTGNFTQSQTGATYTLTVNNIGNAATSGAVTATDTLPLGLGRTGISGTGWNCTLATLTCTRSDVLAAHSSYPPITVTVNVLANAAPSVTNNAAVSGGSEIVTSNDTASDPTTITQEPNLTITKSHNINFTSINGGTYSIVVHNSGFASTSGTYTVVDTIPTGLTVFSISGPTWLCDSAPTTATCTRSSALSANTDAPAITVQVGVQSNSLPFVTNRATVSGGGEVATDDDSASDPTVIDYPDLGIVKSHTGNLSQGQVGATYLLTVSNNGPIATSGTVTMTDTLPSGLTATGISGTGWSCTLGTLTCTRSDALASLASYPDITVTVNVASNAAASVTNHASISGVGDLNPNNDTASDPTTINPASDLTVAASHTDTFTQGLLFRHYTITVSNAGGAATSGTVTMTDSLPAGLTAVALGGTGWTCRPATLVCSRSDALAGNASYPAITLTVNVATNAAASVTNSATVSGGAETNTSNDTATDPTTVAAAPTSCGTFGNAITSAAGTSPTSVAVGDFNNDGIPDLAVADQNTQKVAILLGAGNGTFAAPLTITIGSVVSAVAVADLDGDGRQDIVVAGTGQLFVLLANGNATFAAPVAYTAHTSPAFILIADFNGDGKLDLAALNVGSNDVSFLLGNGNGTFAAAVNSAAGVNPYRAAIADFNADGKLDIITITTTSDSFSFLAGNGDGTFATPATTHTSVAVRGVAAGDLNGDGKLDVVVSSGANSNVFVFLGNGNGTFAAPVSYGAAGGQPGDVSIADLNGDGKPDVVVNDGSKVSVYVGNGNGTLSAETYYGANLDGQALTLADLNGDGRVDIAVVNLGLNTVTVLPAACPDLTISKSHTGNFFRGEVGATYAIAVTNSGSGATRGTVSVTDAIPAGLTATAIAGANWNCVLGTLTCTRSDALAAGATYAQPITVTVSVAGNAAATLTNQATASGGAEANAANDTASDVTTVNATQPPASDLTVAMSHSGNFTQGQTFRTYTINVTNSGSGATIAPTTLVDTLPAGLTAVSIGGTGWSCKTTLTCTYSGSVAASASFPAVTVRVNVASNAPPSLTNSVSVSVLYDANTGNNTATDPTTIIATNATCGTLTTGAPTTIPSDASYIAVGDFNGDGKSDIAVNQGGSGIQILPGNGDGTFAAPLNNPAVISAGALAIGDVNGDGKLDIVSISFPSSILVMLGAGDGTFGAASTYAVGTNLENNLALADLNGDGILDVAVTSGNSTVSILIGNGDGSFGAPVAYGTGNFTNAVAAGDFNADGKLDLVVTNEFDSSISVLLGNGDGTFAAKADFATNGGQPFAVTVGDFNSDGKLDIATGNSGVSVFPGNGDGTFQTAVNYSPGNQMTAVAAADVNHDGKLDLVFLNSGSKAVDIARGNGDGTFASAELYGPGNNTPISMVLGDFKGNGKVNVAVGTQNVATVTLLLQSTCPDLTITKSHTGNFTQGQTGKTYSITATNSGDGPTTGTVTVVDTLPSGLTATAMNGAGWTCTLGTLTCTRSDVVAGTASYPAINVTVNVANNAAASVTNHATVTGGGEAATNNDSASDPTTIVQVADLTVTKSHAGNFTQGQVGATYTITVNNIGPGPTSGTVTAVDTLPSGLTATAISGTGWSCTLATLTCTRSDVLSASASDPAITVTVNVAANAAASVTNSVAVSGGGELVTNNDSATDPTTVVAAGLAAPVITAAATSTTQINISWNTAPTAVNYQIFRRTGGSGFSLLTTIATTSYNDSGLSPNTVYVYRVTAVDSSNNTATSIADSAITMFFTDDPLVAHSTTIKAAHIAELRAAINAARTAAGLTAAVFTDASLSGVRIKAVHITELRTNLDAARSELGLPALTYTDAVLGGLPMRASQVQELRNGVK